MRSLRQEQSVLVEDLDQVPNSPRSKMRVEYGRYLVVPFCVTSCPLPRDEPSFNPAGSSFVHDRRF